MIERVSMRARPVAEVCAMPAGLMHGVSASTWLKEPRCSWRVISVPSRIMQGPAVVSSSELSHKALTWDLPC